MAVRIDRVGAGLSGRSLGLIAAGVAVAAAILMIARRANGPIAAGMQTLTAGDAFTILIQGHRRITDLFRRIIETAPSQTAQRARLLQLKYELLAHALAEENIVYPALRQHAQFRDGTGELYSEHADIKTYLYELEEMAKDDPAWIGKVTAFRDLVAEHIVDEEQNVFPKYRAMLDDRQLHHLTNLVKREEMMARL